MPSMDLDASAGSLALSDSSEQLSNDALNNNNILDGTVIGAVRER